MLREILTIALIAAAARAAGAAGPVIEVDTGGAEWIRPEEAFTLRLDPGAPDDGSRLAVVVGSTDVTDLFRRTPEGLEYRTDLRPLPPGESDLVVYRVEADGRWAELDRFRLQVLSEGGFRSVETTPRLDLASQGLVDRGGDQEAEDRGLDDWTGQAVLDARLTRAAAEIDVDVQLQGATADEQALRFSELGPDAPSVDLASYSLAVRRGRGSFELGHLAWGSSRYLIDGFASRGAALTLPLWTGAEVGVAAVNGTSIVGWDNTLGLSDGDHQVLAGRFGAELLPARPGALQVGVTVLDGSLRPEASFLQGAVTDAEQSDGVGVDLHGATWAGRVRLDASWARSRFDNPFDAALAQGDDLVPVAEEERDARALDLEVDLLSDRPLGERFTTRWTLGYHHGLVEPQYRSVAAFVQADRRDDLVRLTGALGPAAVQLAHSRSRDNLDDVPSILTTRTRTDVASLSVPLAQLREGTGLWWPVVSYSWQRTHQKGDDVPVDSGFDPSHVPDQVSRSQGLGLDWSGAYWRFGYRFDGSDQDNRQPGRELADFETRVHSFSGGLSWTRVDLGLDLSEERGRNVERGERTTTRRYGLNGLWRTTERWGWNGSLSRSRSHTDPTAARNESWEGDLQTTYRLGPWGGTHGVSGQLYLRYSNTRFDASDPVFGFAERRRAWAIRSGLNLSLY